MSSVDLARVRSQFKFLSDDLTTITNYYLWPFSKIRGGHLTEYLITWSTTPPDLEGPHRPVNHLTGFAHLRPKSSFTQYYMCIVYQISSPYNENGQIDMNPDSG